MDERSAREGFPKHRVGHIIESLPALQRLELARLAVAVLDEGRRRLDGPTRRGPQRAKRTTLPRRAA